MLWALILSQTSPAKPPKPKLSLVGTYRFSQIDRKTKVDMYAHRPEGQVMWLTLRRNGTFIMRDMMVGFEGTWKSAATTIDLTATQGPAGKMKKPDPMLLKIADQKRLILIKPAAPGYDSYFTWTSAPKN